MEERWKYYVTSYSLSHPTEGVSHEDLHVPFLEKIIEAEQDNDDENAENPKFSPEGVSRSTLRIKIDPETYFLEIESGSSDVFSRKSVNRFPQDAEGGHYKAKTARKKDFVIGCLNGKRGWRKDLDGENVQLIEDKLLFAKKNGTLEGFGQLENDQERGLPKSTETDSVKKESEAHAPESISNGTTSNTVESEERGGNDTTAEDVEV